MPALVWPHRRFKVSNICCSLRQVPQLESHEKHPRATGMLCKARELPQGCPSGSLGTTSLVAPCSGLLWAAPQQVNSSSSFHGLLSTDVTVLDNYTTEAYYEPRDTKGVSPTAEVTQVPENIDHLTDFSVWWITEYYKDWQTLGQTLIILPTQELC